METISEKSWQEKMAEVMARDEFANLARFVDNAFACGIVYPPKGLIFEAFNRCPFDKVKVVILGQDPYHGEGQAHGLAFSVRDGIKPPPSLVNIYKELEAEFKRPVDKSRGDLSDWAEQGVLLLNATLTVEASRPASHQGKGWEEFTDQVINILSKECDHLVFILWGAPARKKGSAIDRSKHLVLEGPHPSPLSAYRGFFGCGHFLAANEYLMSFGKTPIQWVR